jgi:ATP-dependent DNA ligase
VLDGELVVYRGGRCEFGALQRRVSGRPSVAVAASFVVFDVLAVAGRDLAASRIAVVASGCGGSWTMPCRRWR